MKKLFLDTEFNGFQGKLMSMALVPEDDSPEFYKEIVMTDQLDPWVKDNVVPHMNALPISVSEFRKALGNYLRNVGDCTIVADWPDDIRHLCESLITGPGECLWPLPNIKFELDWNIRYNSEIPHHALWDARAIKEYYEIISGNN